MKASEFRKLIREEIRRVIKEVDNEVVLSNEILDFLEERGVISANSAQKIHKDLTSFLKSKIIKEEESFGDDIAKQIQADRLAQQRKFIAWAKATAAKQNIKLNFNGDAMVTVSLSKLERKNMLTKDLLDKWKAAKEGSEENDLWQGLTVLVTRYKILK